MKRPDTADHYIAVGKIGAPHGINGWVKIISMTQNPDALMGYRPWYVKATEGWEVLKIDELKPHDKHLLAHIVGVDNIDAARRWTNKEIAVLRSQLPKLKNDQFYWADLEELDVITKQGIKLGKIASLIETGSNDVLVVKGEKEHLIPFIYGSVVLEVNRERKTVIVDWDWEF